MSAPAAPRRELVPSGAAQRRQPQAWGVTSSSDEELRRSAETVAEAFAGGIVEGLRQRGFLTTKRSTVYATRGGWR
jgi:hypothetical protein